VRGGFVALHFLRALDGFIGRGYELRASSEGVEGSGKTTQLRRLAAEIAREAGLNVVSNRCVKIEHARFHGGLHLAGFDTGVISSKRTRG